MAREAEKRGSSNEGREREGGAGWGEEEAWRGTIEERATEGRGREEGAEVVAEGSIDATDGQVD